VRETSEFRNAQATGELISLPTGDGMALVFLHDTLSPVKCSLEIANALKRFPAIKLRMGVHMGPVSRHADIKDEVNVVGTGINIAQRVMDCGDGGHILLSETAASVLQQLRDWQEYLQDLGVHEVKHGVQLHIFNLCKDGLGNPEPPQKLARRGYHPRRRREFWTRRRFSGVAVATICAAGAGAWWKRDDIQEMAENILEPLPEKRYVALMAWPTSDYSAVVSTVLDSIGQRLARAEAFVKNLLIVKTNDLPDKAESPITPAQSANALGANLVLAAALQPTPARTWLNLQVLHAPSQRVIRSARVSCAPAALSSIAEKASEAAAKLLGLPIRETSMQDAEELRRLSPETFKAFSEAEELLSQPNDTGLKGAVNKYQRALDMDPHFALGYARLAMAYTKQFLADRESANLKLAQNNATLSLRYNPSSAKGLLSQAMVFLYSGQTADALDYFARSLKADPGNPETLLYKAQALRNAHQWPEAEQVYKNIATERPNYWLAHNELGWILYRQAKYQQAADEFDAAATAAPQVALPLANLSSIYMYLGKNDQAIDAAKRSIERSPNEEAYITLGNIAFSRGNYKSALESFQRAADLNPNSDMIWGNIGDCYTMLNEPSAVKVSYEKASELLAAALKANPRSGERWATLAFYHAKVGDASSARLDLKNAETQGAKDVQSQFMMAQALALLGEKEEALKLLLACMDKGLSTVQVDLALDLRDIRKNPRYLAHISKLGSQMQ